MPPYARLQSDVNMREEAELRRLERGESDLPSKEQAPSHVRRWHKCRRGSRTCTDHLVGGRVGHNGKHIAAE